MTCKYHCRCMNIDGSCLQPHYLGRYCTCSVQEECDHDFRPVVIHDPIEIFSGEQKCTKCDVVLAFEEWKKIDRTRSFKHEFMSDAREIKIEFADPQAWKDYQSVVMDRIGYFKGKGITEMTREELLDFADFAGKRITMLERYVGTFPISEHTSFYKKT